ncbi:hypothetical protein Q5H93_12820 [Hymenobacter sp. ASUV-10]|uniref:Lipoprotein n=1 Tax=Hymenobacter aranciens TaxID=3063996 RepID=A0ABT9BD36_9BACT|nr:hypothetical protein [Hymenobacter sp. ASUV-10]MDO7875619.1 hypothetical protein [Hymenobacter sp. ASUV-10]
MNFLRLPALGLLLTLAACSSDKKDDPAPATPATPAAGLRWTEGGTTYTATQPLFYVVATTNMVSISGSHTASGVTRSIGINVPQAVGTYSLNAPASGTAINMGMYTVVGNGTTGIYAASGPSQGSGTVTITSISPTSVVGTFSLRADDRGTPVTSKTISEGQFNLTK